MILKKNPFVRKIKSLICQPEFNLLGGDGFILIFCCLPSLTHPCSKLPHLLPKKKNPRYLDDADAVRTVAKNCTGSAQMVD